MNTNNDWLLRRGISQEVIDSFGLHYGDHVGLEDCLVIPINTPDGVFSFNKYRRNPSDERKPKYLYDKGGRMTLFGADHLTDTTDTVVITEGELDALVLWSMNIPAVSSTGGAMAFNEEWVDLLKGKQVFICFDNDDPGSDGAVKVLGLIPDAKVIFIPEHIGTKDISDFVAKGGDFHGLMDSAKQYLDELSVLEDMRTRSSSWLPTRFHNAWLKKHRDFAPQQTSERKTVSDDKVENARNYPIKQILKFDRNQKAICPFHKEKTPSLHYYAKTNSTYCFGGCGKRYDAIDIYRKVNGASFKDAVEDLNRL